MLNVPTLKPEQFATPHFEEFRGASEAVLESIDPLEVLGSITREDIATSQLHPNNFYVKYLTDPQERFDRQVRLHIWHQGDFDRADGDIHKHPWHLASKVIMGTYLEKAGQVTPVAEEDADFLSVCMERDLKRGTTTLLGRTPVKAALSDLESSGPNTMHAMPETDYHFTPVPSDSLLVTLVFMGRTLSNEDIFLRPIRESVPPVEPVRGRPDESMVEEIWRQLQAAREELQGVSS